MRAAEKRQAIRTVFGAQDTLDSLRNQLRALGDAIGAEAAKDVDALSLKLGGVLDEALEHVATTPVDAEARTPEQQAADLKAAAVKDAP